MDDVPVRLFALDGFPSASFRRIMRTGLPGERWGVVDNAGRRFVGAEVQAHKIFGWRALISQAAVSLEAESAIVGRITKNHTPSSSSGAKLRYPRADQSGSNASGLMLGFD